VALNVREAAAAALEAKRRQDAKQEEQDQNYHRYMVREAIHSWLKLAVGSEEGVNRGFHLEVDGLLFAHPSKVCSQKDLRLVYRCDTCDREILSVPIQDLAHLGQMLEAPELDKMGPCVNGGPKHAIVHALAPKLPPRRERKRPLDL